LFVTADGRMYLIQFVHIPPPAVIIINTGVAFIVAGPTGCYISLATSYLMQVSGENISIFGLTVLQFSKYSI